MPVENSEVSPEESVNAAVRTYECDSLSHGRSDHREVIAWDAQRLHVQSRRLRQLCRLLTVGCKEEFPTSPLAASRINFERKCIGKGL